jgi:tetratricopeptide (TPR) repeat protein
MIGSIGFAYFTLRQYVQRSLTPQELYSEGLALLNEGSYRKAASHFADFTRSYPSDQRRGDAEFMAAYALQLSPATRRSETVQIYNEALVKFESFIASNPTHGKAARARTIAGILHYKLDNYEEAIQILSDPELRLADSAGFIPGLRTLARAYAANYDIENAELTFMKVARLKDNISPANDYIELAALYANLTRNTIEDATRADYLKKSIELWDLAIRVPTLLSAKKRTLIATRDAALGELAELDPAMVVPRTSKIESNPIPVSTPNTDLDLDSLRLPDDAQ